jgi:hypothetical protein
MWILANVECGTSKGCKPIVSNISWGYEQNKTKHIVPVHSQLLWYLILVNGIDLKKINKSSE